MLLEEVRHELCLIENNKNILRKTVISKCMLSPATRQNRDTKGRSMPPPLVSVVWQVAQHHTKNKPSAQPLLFTNVLDKYCYRERRIDLSASVMSVFIPYRNQPLPSSSTVQKKHTQRSAHFQFWFHMHLLKSSWTGGYI